MSSVFEVVFRSGLAPKLVSGAVDVNSGMLLVCLLFHRTYLKHEELQEPLPNTDNPWLKFVNSSQLLQESPVLFKAQVRQSLVQVEDNLRTAINVALTKPSSAIGQSLQCSGSSYLFTYQNMDEKEEKNKLLKPKFTHFTVCNQQAYQYVVFTASCSPSDYLYLVRQKTHAGSDGADISIVKLKFGCLGTTNREESGRDDSCDTHKILDVAFYNQEKLSVLLLEDQLDGLPVLAQVSISNIEDDQFNLVPNGQEDCFTQRDIHCIDAGPPMEPMYYRRLENMKAYSFAVSGTRHVACVLFSSRRRVRLFLMDAEDDEDEDDTELSIQSTQDISTISRDTTEEDDKENTDTSGMDG
ncbi:anaphase-promoting complex subunit 4-like [Lingula anatina]|uniref:Anaphase-promoting complex subunit 4-like n=1 Tax=Lingula anatina TaxID=7574 RepID=A0A1S3IZW0_LINAN|nr:anaphase-promoting complex subunit 4-like [Lingula anatina]|eukprot:XP_013403084.1 anaphase-promoting complex subunit 4-like [Lingula anatina]